MSKGNQSIIGALVLAFTVLFTAAALAQYYFVRAQLNSADESQLKGWITEIEKEIADHDHWDLLGFRRSSVQAPNFYVIASDGLLVDTEGFVSGLIPQVIMPRDSFSDRPVNFESAIGERGDCWAASFATELSWWEFLSLMLQQTTSS
jgi:hypothetical protein